MLQTRLRGAGHKPARRASYPIDLLWLGYLALAPVVWLPGVPPSAVAGLKAILFVTAGLFTLAATPRTRLPPGPYGPLGLALVTLGLSFSIFQSSTATAAIRPFFEVGVGFATLWLFFRYQARTGSFFVVAGLAGLFHALLSAVVLADAAGLVSLQTPQLAVSPNLGTVGFTAARTGWSNGVAPFVPLLLALAVRQRSALRVLLIAGVVTTMISQLVLGGRAGLTAALVGCLIVLAITFSVRGLLFPAVVLASIAVVFSSFFTSQLRLTNWAGSPQSLDAITSGRLVQYEQAWDLFNERPLLGYGAGNVVIDERGSAVHNLFLRLGAEGGVVALVVVLTFVGWVTIASVRSAISVPTADQTTRSSAGAIAGALASGTIIALVEPAMILGAMHNSAIWWASAGVAALGIGGLRGSTSVTMRVR